MTATWYRSLREPITTLSRTDGIAFVVGAALFFAGSGLLTRSGTPGASTPLPWLGSHLIWIGGTAFVAIGILRLLHQHTTVRSGLAGPAAIGLFGLGVLHSLQWATWVYVDIIAYTQGAHDPLFDPLLHPFGTGHMLMYAALVGAGTASLAAALADSDLATPHLDRTGLVLGVGTSLVAVSALAMVADVRAPISLATIGLTALVYGWIFVRGLVLARPTTGNGGLL